MHVVDAVMEGLVLQWAPDSYQYFRDCLDTPDQKRAYSFVWNAVESWENLLTPDQVRRKAHVAYREYKQGCWRRNSRRRH